MQSFVCIPIRLDIFNRIPYNIVSIIPFRSPTMKKRILWIIISFNFIIFPLYQTSHATDLILNNTLTQVYFSPRGGCTEAIVSQINKAKSEILVQASSFTSATFLANSGIPTLIDDRHAIAHNKIMIFERETVITGSFNFTKAAEEKNKENKHGF